MNDGNNLEEEARLRENGLEFFGAITASVSHELNNVISIIDQTAGLLEDFLAGAEQGRPISNERLDRIAKSVRKQTERGVRVIKRMNTFAHSVDDPVKEFEVNTLTETMSRLTQRLASLKRVELATDLPAGEILVTNSPFLTEQAIFLCIGKFLDNGPAEGVITLSVTDCKPGICVKIKVKGLENPMDTGGLEYLQLLLKRMQGSLEYNPAETVFTLNIPSL